ncbi:DNA cytosine methyltransferase [Anaerocolumna sp. MB42-C2]|uniref:DNA cytosine methyltransferase n=1 Tax=Anaerocolumna sp. MB42-C2 TaxID=3070997 RepID=UPI0027DEFEC7|nr:DNA (cytosine-5-)-methyltransferase [Anaerocolumna sp. MB42-C2]WMJ87755.1 DNA (cytosine-5-)-methyltransferase [Anaerocolumna sp. MB42-C2]
MSRKYKMIDLFAGCGGLEDGFLQSNRYNDIAAVEWLKPQVNTLIHRLETKWNIKDAKQRVLHFDIQREEELFSGWKDDEFGENKGLDYYVKKADGIDVIIGGPPCQAYSVAGRVRDENGMKDDYRNYLFEHYLNVVDRYKPKVFVFENVPGLLSAIPDGTPITKLIRDGFNGIGYEIVDDIKKYTKLDASDYGVPQSRNRLIILGIRREIVDDPQEALHKFYNEFLPKYKVKHKKTVEDAIGDLPPIYPTFDKEKHKKKEAYTIPNTKITWHESRYHSIRDMKIFGMLADDIESGRNEYVDSKVLSKIYEEQVGSKSPIHRYHVLKRDEPSTTIIAHLHKDGNRFIHYDPKQCRSITPREAARLQSFDDDFDFLGNRGNAYQMIGNAVPPLLAKKVSLALAELLDELI